MSKAVFVPLATEPFADFAMGAKTVEIRNFDSPVARQVVKDTTPGRRVTLSHGYGKKIRLNGRLGRIAMVASATHLPKWAKDGAAVNWARPSRFFDRSAKLVAFEVLPAFQPSSTAVDGGGS